MDQTVSAQITSAESDGIRLLQLQNHIYGCFVLMEDIAERNIVLTDYEFKRANYVFNIDKQFAEIGIRYGFIMDTKLLMTTYLPEYKEGWLQIFKSILTLDAVDTLEDSIIAIIKSRILPELAFFLHALETGSLPQEWINNVIQLLIPSSKDPIETPKEADEPIVKSIISTAKMEKPKKFRTTKRNPIVVTKSTSTTFFRKTRRSK